MSELNRDILRWVLLIGSAPVWWPFLRTLWGDFNAALREDGGLFGRPPGPRELERLRSERASTPPTLLSERIVQPGDRRRTRLGARKTARSTNAPAQPSAPGSRETAAPARASTPRFR